MLTAKSSICQTAKSSICQYCENEGTQAEFVTATQLLKENNE